MTKTEEVSKKKKLKKKLIHNFIELLVWVLLLWMCFWYIQTHPAEKVSFFSGYKVVYQQVEIFFQNIFGKNGYLLKQKYDLESYYQVLITLSEEKYCLDHDLVEDLHSTYEKLQKEPKNTLNHTLHYYIEKQNYFDQELRKDCDTLVDVNYEESQEDENDLNLNDESVDNLDEIEDNIFG